MALWGRRDRERERRERDQAAQLPAAGGAWGSTGYNSAGSSAAGGVVGGTSSSDLDDATRLLLRARADAFYRGLSGEQKAAFDNCFADADASRRGRITLPELLKLSEPRDGDEHDAIVKLFHFLDSGQPNGDHLLSFADCLVIFYISTSSGRLRLCSSCAFPVLPMLGYSCRLCWEQAPPSGAPFNLCHTCYSFSRFPPHPHPPSSFVDYINILYALTLNKSTQASTAMSTNPNATTMGLEPHHQLQLAQMQMEQQQVQMLANIMSNAGNAVNSLAPGPSYDTFTYGRPFF